MSQSENAEESLLFGTAARRQQLYPDSGNYDASMEASAPSAQPGAPVHEVLPDSSSGSGNASAMQFAPPPPMTPHPSMQAGVDQWATVNTGVRNINGSQPSDMGFGVLNEQYTGNAPLTPTSAMNGQRSSTSMEWEQVQTPLLAQPAQPVNTGNGVGERPRPSVNPGLNGGSGMQHQQRTSFTDVYGMTHQLQWPNTREAVPTAEPVWSQPILTTQPLPTGSVPPGLVNNMTAHGPGQPNVGSAQMGPSNTWFQDAVHGMQAQSAPYGAPPAQQYSALQQPQAVHATPVNNTGDRMEQIMFALAQSTSMIAQAVSQTQLTQPPRGAGNTGNSNAFKSLKPKMEVTKITAATEELLFDELQSFEDDLRDLGIFDYAEAAFYQLKNAVEGAARDIIDLALFEARLGIKTI